MVSRAVHRQDGKTNRLLFSKVTRGTQYDDDGVILELDSAKTRPMLAVQVDNGGWRRGM